jgi:ComF family protein
MLASIVFPRRCAICGRPGQDLCDGCHRGLRRLAPPLCDRCGSPGAWPVRRCAECAGRRLAFTRARSAIVYEASARAFVSAWKERGQRTLASVAADLIDEAITRPDVEALVPVPADPGRSRRRGHTPPARLALELGNRWELPVLVCLRRDRDAVPQHGLGLQERRRNLRGVFQAVGPPAPRRVCVVDDVYTTGSTASACGTVLRTIGASHVEIVCLARAMR